MLFLKLVNNDLNKGLYIVFIKMKRGYIKNKNSVLLNLKR